MPPSPINLLSRLLAPVPDLDLVHDADTWRAIQENAGRYGVAALVAHAIRPYVAGEKRTWCDRVLIQSWQRHEKMLGELEDIMERFDRAGIPAIALKGPLLARRYYEPACLRKPSMDLDLGVVERDLEAACKVLAEAGYKLGVPVGEAVARSHHAELTHPSRPKIELHLRLSHMDLGIRIDEFFDRSVAHVLPSGRVARVLGPADQLLHLVLHLAQSRFGTLFHLYEILHVCRSELAGVREEAIRRAVEHRFRGVLRMTDVALRTRWGARFLLPGMDVPATWLDWRINEKLFSAFEHWSVPGRELNPATRLWGRWLDFQITDAPSDAVRSIRRLIRVSGFVNARQVWVTPKNLGYGPDYAAGHVATTKEGQKIAMVQDGSSPPTHDE